MTSGGNNFNDFSDNQLTKFPAVKTVFEQIGTVRSCVQSKILRFEKKYCPWSRAWGGWVPAGNYACDRCKRCQLKLLNSVRLTTSLSITPSRHNNTTDMTRCIARVPLQQQIITCRRRCDYRAVSVVHCWRVWPGGVMTSWGAQFSKLLKKTLGKSQKMTELTKILGKSYEKLTKILRKTYDELRKNLGRT